jgi:outer membrane protein assembly factor BamB
MYLSGINNNFLKKKIGKNKFSFSQNKLSPIIGENFIILTDDTGTLFNINKNGKIKWKKNIYKKIYKKIYKNLSVSVYNETIFVSDNIGFIYSLELETGKILWIKNHGIPLKSKIKIFDEKIFLINSDNRIICFETKTGAKVWDVRTVSSFIKTQNFLALAVSENGEVFTINSSGELIKLSSINGQIYWSINITPSLFAHDKDFFESSDIVISGEDIIFSTTKSIFSYNLNNRYENWKLDIHSVNTPIIDGNNVFIVSNNGFFININKTSGKIIWSTNIIKILKKRKRNTHITGFILGSGKIYSTTHNGFIIVSSAIDGNTEYFKKIGDSITANPIIVDGSLYILTNKPKLFGFN